MTRKKLLFIFLTILLIVIALFLSIEARPFSVVSSTVYKTSEKTEIYLHVVMNTVLAVNEEEISKEIILEHQEINGVKKDVLYVLSMYRTSFHYRKNWKYNMIICDGKGAIICCEEDLGV